MKMKILRAIIDCYSPIDLELAEAQILESGHEPLKYDENTTINEKTFNAKGEHLLELMRKANLLNYVHENLPPFIIQRGGNDSLVSCKQFLELKDELVFFYNKM